MVMTVGIACLIAVPARAADYGAVTNGNWNSPSTWTPSAVPGSSDTAYIGSIYPGGAAATATVMLTQNQQANTVVLGYGAGTSGTLDLGNFKLTANALYLGFNGGTGAVDRGTGSFDVGALRLSGSTLLMSASDQTRGNLGDGLFLYDGSAVTTAATGNVSNVVRVQSGSTLTLGADLYAGALTNSYTIEISGANSTLDAQGHKISTPDLSIGWEYVNQSRVPGDHVVQFLNRGDLDVSTLFVANQALNLSAADQVTSFYLSNGSTTFAPGAVVYSLELQNGATATTAAAGNITGSAGVRSGSALTLAADLVAESVAVEGDNSSTLDAQFHKITALALLIGWNGGANARLLNRGDLAVTELLVANQILHLTAADQVTNFSLSNGSTSFIPAVAVSSLFLQDGATAATSATANITAGVDVTSGSTLTLGADLSVSGYVVAYGDDSTIDAQGHKITAGGLRLGVDGGTNVRLLNKGELAVTELYVADQAFNLGTADAVTDFHLINGSTNLEAAAVVQDLYLRDASATTAVTGNLTGSVDVLFGSTLTLGADLSVSGYVHADFGDNSAIDAQGHKITADTLSLGYLGVTNVRLLNKGELAVTNLYLGHLTTPLNLSAADATVNFVLFNGSTASTAATGNVTGSVTVFAGSTLTLGADVAVTGAVHVGQDDSTLNAQGHSITANTLSLGYFDGGDNVRLLNRGNLAVTNLYVGSQDFNLTAADQVTNFTLIYGKTTLGTGVAVQRLAVQDHATATTSATGNVTGSVDLVNVGNSSIQSKLTLGADLILSGHLNARGNTITINAQGHNITAAALSLEFDAFGNPASPIQLLNDGAITVGGPLALAGGVQLELHDGNDTAQSLWLSEDSVLTIRSAATGFTLGGTTEDDLLFNGTSTLTLELNGLQPGWMFRWANPDGGDHIAQLSDLIARSQIELNVINGGEHDVVSQNGYTYIVQPVPEPVALGVIALCLQILVRRKPLRKTERRIS